jgi:diguanylate cyclase (GGDEF)-like protein/PAS domain S-box-containing protein
MFVTTKSPIFDELGNVMGTVGQAHDVTELNNISSEMSLFIENMPFGVIISNEEDIIMNVNTKMESLTGYSRRKIVGTKAQVDFAKDMELVSKTAEKDVYIVETDFRGEHRILELTKMHINDVFKNPVGIMRIFKDVTAERTLEIQVKKSANTDFLTGLYNRRYFYEYINAHCIGKPISILTLDLDNFKGINDTYGHHVGDEALVLTADTLRRSFSSDLIVRNGGDEFLVILINDDLVKIENKVKTILQNLNSAFGERLEFRATSASIGVAVTPSLSNNLDEILRKSDMALYEAKRNHKGSYAISN